MKVLIGDIFESKCSALVNTVNCVGTMGKGIALEFKKRYPAMYQDYLARCERGDVRPGKPYFYQETGRGVLNFPTKDHWRSPSRLSYIIEGLDWFVENYEKCGITSIAFPPLGCGNGGLVWSVVGPIMYRKLVNLPINIEVYAPYGTKQEELSEQFLSKGTCTDELVGKNPVRVNPKWKLVLEVVRQLNQRRYALLVGRTIYQKICYVLTRHGIQTGFNFVKGSYGPYSDDAKRSITALANANLVTERRLGKMVTLEVGKEFSLDRTVYSPEELNALEKTVDLFGRVKNTEQAEMIATVLYAYDQLAANTSVVLDKELYDYVIAWKPHWKKEKEFELCDTIHNLAMLSLIKLYCTGELMDTMLV